MQDNTTLSIWRNVTENPQNDSFSCYHPSVVGYRYFGVVWGCIVTTVGTVGNLMTILAFVLDPRLRTRFNLLIINLALADLLYCTVLQPISVDSYLHLQWRGGSLWCSTFGLLLFLSNSVSILTLCLISVSRYLLVEKRRVFDRVFSVLGLSLLLPSTWALGLASFGPLWPVFVFAPEVCTCSFHRTKGRPYSTILLFFYFFIGLGCVGFFYLLIYRRVRVASQALTRYRFSRRSSRRKPASLTHGTEDSGVETGVANTSSCDMSSQDEPALNKSKASWEMNPGESQPSQSTLSSPQPAEMVTAPHDYKPVSSSPGPAPVEPSTSNPPTSGDDSEFKRVTRMCFTVFLCFVFCFVPFMLLNIADKRNRAPQVLHMFCANLTWLNSCINPLLYAVMNRQFRQAYNALLSRAAAPFSCLWTWRDA